MDKAFDKLTWQDVHRPGSRGRRGVTTRLGCSVEKKTLKRTLDSAGDPPKPFPNKALTKSSQSDLVKITGEHPELVKLIKAWPQLPVHIKTAIKALIQSY